MIICTYNMQREAERTLFSAVAPYQKGVGPGDYEIILIDNGSEPPLRIPDLPAGVALHRVENAQRSPVFALNWAARELARGDLLLFAIDGARIFSHRMFETMLKAHAALDGSFVYSLGWHIGPKLQHQSIVEGYNAAVEDALIAGAGWPTREDALFDISVFAGSSKKGHFNPIAESNAFSISRSMFDRFGGYDERFRSPGGGLANLELFERYITRRRARNICLLSEGTFHQVHDSVSVSGDSKWSLLDGEYQDIFGRSYKVPDYSCLYFGKPRPAVVPHLIGSLETLYPRVADPSSDEKAMRKAHPLLRADYYRGLAKSLFRRR
ncbi:MAG: hypothetical protein M9939_25495 [Mesorhizobium sp.]|nr:hypothetical protein [Mesorhizobium sp.]MCO5164448.1 hypothetical protein [Mesorhizobium sp.]